VNITSFKTTVVAFLSPQQHRRWYSCTPRPDAKNNVSKRWKVWLGLVEGDTVGLNNVGKQPIIESRESLFHDNNRPTIGVYLLSFPNLYQNNITINSNISSTAIDPGNSLFWRKKIKQWKQYCLGDGGVYFDERPETLKALNGLLCKTLTEKLRESERHRFRKNELDATNSTIVEIVVLSTCARFEILSVVQYTDSAFISNNAIRDMVQQSILETIVQQIHYHQSRWSFRIQKKLPFNVFDRPSRICNEIPLPKQSKIDSHLLNALYDEIHITEGVKDVSERLCLIAAGLLDRPIFRPFSSRDTHVMHQIKQSSICSVTSAPKAVHVDENTAANDSTKYCKILFDAALQSGKGARSFKVVPILHELRDASHGANGPPDLSARAADSAIHLAVRPAVDVCVSKFKAFQATQSIVGFRQVVESFVQNITGGKIHLENRSCANIRRLLHSATMELREGNHVDIDAFLEEVASELSMLSVSENDEQKQI